MPLYIVNSNVTHTITTHDYRSLQLLSLLIQDKGKKADFIVHDDRSLLALQGPAAHDALQPLLKDLDLKKFYFSNFAILDIAGIPCWLTRTG